MVRKICDLILVACDGKLAKEFLPGPVVDKRLLCSNGGHHLDHNKKKIPGQIVDITDNLLQDEQ